MMAFLSLFGVFGSFFYELNGPGRYNGSSSKAGPGGPILSFVSSVRS